MDVRIQFSKGYEVKYVSHLDLMRTFNRMLTRSGMPVSYTQGFNPHIILTFAQPLSVGVTSDGEFAEFQLDEEYSTEEIKQMLNDSAPEGIRILKVSNELNPKFKELNAAVYEVVLQSNFQKDVLNEVLQKDEILIDKKTKKGIKEINIKPMLFEYELKETEDDTLLLTLKVAAGSEQNLNPDLVIKAFEKYIPGFQLAYKSVHRTKLLTKNGLEFIN